MPDFSRRMLFIVHDASRSGAPVLLLHLLRWIRQNKPAAAFDILLLKDGALRKDFEALAKTYTIPERYRYNLVNKIKVRLHPERSQAYKISEVTARLSGNKYGLIYGNTIVSLPWLLGCKRLPDTKMVCAIHELSNAIAFYFDREYVLTALPQVDLIIAGSHAVQRNLENEFGIEADKIKVFHSFIDRNYTLKKNAGQLRHELGIQKGELVIGGMSQIELRKGVDLVVPLAAELKNKYPEVKFKMLWVGGRASDNFIQIVQQDAVKCGVAEQVLFISSTSYPDDYINLYDIFLLLSREDPFPLVLLSAAYMEKGIIAFEKSGGAAELLSDGAGFMAPYLNIHEVAAIIADLYHHPDKIKTAGEIARKKVELEFNSGIIPDLIFSVLEELI